jgi:hypothetical protein
MTLWLDGIKHIPSTHNGGAMRQNNTTGYRFVWHTYEADPFKLSATQGANSLITAGNEVHFVLNPITGELVQLLPANVAGRGLKHTNPSVPTNGCGDICLQCEVIAFAAEPFTKDITSKGLASLHLLVNYARQLGVPNGWPAGSPPEFPRGSNVRSSSVWVSHGGHYGHSQIPQNDHGDPGAINIGTISGTTTQEDGIVASIYDLLTADCNQAAGGTHASIDVGAALIKAAETLDRVGHLEDSVATMAADIAAIKAAVVPIGAVKAAKAPSAK